MYEFTNYLIVATLSITAVLGLFVFLRNRESKITLAFLYLISSFVIWSLLLLWQRLVVDLDMAVIIANYIFILAVLMTWAYYNFVYKFPYVLKPISKKYFSVGLVFSIISVVLNVIPGLVITGATREYFGKAYELNYVYFTFYVASILYVITGAIIIQIQKLRKSSGENRILLKYFLVSSMIPVIAIVTFALIFYYWSNYYLSDISLSFTLFFTVPMYYLVFVRQRIY